MSSLRRSTRDSSWQWMIIGVVFGFGCCGVFSLGLYALGVLRVTPPGQSPEALAPTVVVVVTATPPAETPTDAAAVNTVPPVPPTQNTSGVNVIPSATAFTILPTDANATASTAQSSPLLGTPIASPVSATAVPVQPNATQNPAPTVSGQSIAQAGNPSAPPSIPMTDLIGVTGGIFEMGTTQKEITQAVDDCLSRDKGKCDASMAEDSFPAHNVTVNAFRMEKYEVSNDQFVAFLNYLGPNSNNTGCGGEPCVATNDAQHQGSYIKFDGTKYSVSNDLFRKRPVSYVTWYGADTYCRTIGRRLPTEAEWERAARDANDKRIYPWGNDWDPAAPKARTSSPKNEGGPDVVDSYPNGKSPDGIFNLAGNVSEWVSDWYDPGYYKTLAPNAIDPQGPEASSVGHKVVRGGDWDAKPFFARTVHRRDYDPIFAETGTIGFRCVTGQDQSAPPTKAPGAPGGASAPQATLPAQAKPTFTLGALQSGNP